MRAARALAGFALVLAVVFVAAFGLGRFVGDDEPGDTRTPATTSTTAEGGSSDHGGHG